MDILLGSSKTLGAAIFLICNERVLPKKKSFVRKYVMNNKSMGPFKKCVTWERGEGKLTKK